MEPNWYYPPTQRRIKFTKRSRKNSSPLSLSLQPRIDITPTGDQQRAIDRIAHWYKSDKQEFYLAGLAGTGKTTVAAAASMELRDRIGITRIMAGAYTGKAANVLRKRGLYEAQTLHSMLYEPIPNSKPLQFRHIKRPALKRADLLILDESSMIGDEIASAIRELARKILVLGDPEQLPPIDGLGSFIRREPDVLLTEIHRQAFDDPILYLAKKVRASSIPVHLPFGDYGKSRVVPAKMSTLIELAEAGAQIICGVHRVRWAITQQIRKTKRFNTQLPLAGERVICCRNNLRNGLFNGMLGYLAEDADAEINAPLLGMKTIMEDWGVRQLRVSPQPFREHFDGALGPDTYVYGKDIFDWGYAITCHKAQGSEWPEVAVVDDSAAFGDAARQWLYTAITRAKNKVTVLRR